MKICMEEKQRTLRPEIQLLNALMATKSSEARKAVSPMLTKTSMNTWQFGTGLYKNVLWHCLILCTAN